MIKIDELTHARLAELGAERGTTIDGFVGELAGYDGVDGARLKPAGVHPHRDRRSFPPAAVCAGLIVATAKPDLHTGFDLSIYPLVD